MKPIAIHNCLLTFSLKISIAISDVATISKLFRSDTLAAAVPESPIIRKIGAAISRTIMPSVKGRSFFARCFSFMPDCFRISPKAAIPAPAPI